MGVSKESDESSDFWCHYRWRGGGSGFTAHSVQRLAMNHSSMPDKLGAVPNTPARVACGLPYGLDRQRGLRLTSR